MLLNGQILNLHNLYCCLNSIKVIFLSGIISNTDIIGKNLCLYIVGIVANSIYYALIWRYYDIDAVGNFQATVLAKVLDAVNQFPCKAFTPQIISKLDLKCNSDVALRCLQATQGYPH